MKELIESTKEFKIIPNNFKSASTFSLLSVDDNVIRAKLTLLDDTDLKDYSKNSGVEIFGVNNSGLVYFETKILSRENDIIELATTSDYSIIQRREYSRVDLKQGTIVFQDAGDDLTANILDISAGGAKIITNKPLEINKYYEVEICLPNNMRINCAFSPIRINENDNTYTISGKFTDLENVDRIVLIQYAFRIKLEEEQSKENE